MKRFYSDAEEAEANQLIKNGSPAPEFRRASGSCLCQVCGKEYRIHPRHYPHLYLNVLCDSSVVKL